MSSTNTHPAGRTPTRPAVRWKISGSGLRTPSRPESTTASKSSSYQGGESPRPHVFDTCAVLMPWVRAERTASIIRSSGTAPPNSLVVRSMASIGLSNPSESTTASRAFELLHGHAPGLDFGHQIVQPLGVDWLDRAFALTGSPIRPGENQSQSLGADPGGQAELREARRDRGRQNAAVVHEQSLVMIVLAHLRAPEIEMPQSRASERQGHAGQRRHALGEVGEEGIVGDPGEVARVASL